MKSQKLHDTLTSLLFQLERDGDVGPILRLINVGKLSHLTQLQIAAWVETYTPFLFSNAVDATFTARKGNKKKAWRTSLAQEYPYWITSEKSSIQLPFTVNDHDLKQQICSERSQKLIKTALNDFLRAPTKPGLEQLTAQMSEYLKYGLTEKGHDAAQRAPSQFANFVSGGLPSLGKRAK